MLACKETDTVNNKHVNIKLVSTSNSDSGHEEDSLDVWQDNQQVVERVAKAWSDIILDYRFNYTYSNNPQNRWHRPCLIKNMINVIGTGDVLSGIADTKMVSVIVSSLILPDVIPHLKSKSIVVHCSVSDYSVLGLVFQSCIPILMSYTPTECYYHSLIAHIFSHYHQLGSIVHVYADHHTGMGHYGQLALLSSTELNRILTTEIDTTSHRQSLYKLFQLTNRDRFTINNPTTSLTIGIVGQPQIKVRLLMNESLFIKELVDIIPSNIKELIVEDPLQGSGLLYSLLLSHFYTNKQLSIQKRCPSLKESGSLTIFDQPHLSSILASQLNELFPEVYYKLDENYQHIKRSQLAVPYLNQTIVLMTEVGLQFLSNPLPDIVVIIGKNTKLSKDLEPFLSQVKWYQLDPQLLPEFNLESILLGVLVHLVPKWKPVLVNSLAKNIVDQLLDQIKSIIKTTPPVINEDAVPTIEYNGYQIYNEVSSSVPDAETHLKWHCLFKSAYDTNLINRPDLDSSNVQLQVSINRRLTPLEYDRNIFHLEFDTTHSQLEYNIGDALGVYGVNDSSQVLSFLQFYNVQPEHVFSFTKENHYIFSNTAFHILSHIMDIFGKPTTQFYTWLAEFATDTQERVRLQNISKDVTLFRQQVDDFITFADILIDHPSAHPNFDSLIKVIPSIAPRHYSIASSQRAHPNSVHLLVVQVTWHSPRGLRYGQCTRYLANLEPGSWVTATIKPSVMHLPKDPTIPIIMAGLGTGLAPFRAFIQDRLISLAHNQPIGQMILYFGARSRASEYLYGDEWVKIPQLTRRCAFSRDQQHKVYIQHLMAEDHLELQSLLLDHGGHFYLCGPTWPEPAVKSALLNAFQSNHRMDLSKAQQQLLNLQEEEKYILELY